MNAKKMATPARKFVSPIPGWAGYPQRRSAETLSGIHAGRQLLDACLRRHRSGSTRQPEAGLDDWWPHLLPERVRAREQIYCLTAPRRGILFRTQGRCRAVRMRATDTKEGLRHAS